MEIVVQNSFCRVEGEVTPQAEELLRAVMTYHNDIESEKGQLFYQMKMAARNKNHRQYHACKAAIAKLEANEYVCLYRERSFPTGLINIVH